MKQRRSRFFRRHLTSPPKRWKRPILAVGAACFSLWAIKASGVSDLWNFDGAGILNWSQSANWLLGTPPNGAGDTASFNFNISADRTINLDTPITLGGLILGDTVGAQAYTFAGPFGLTLDALSGNAFIAKYNSATDVWQAPLVLNDHVSARIHAGILNVNGPGNAQVSLTSAGSGIIKSGAGTLRLNVDASAYQGDWVVNLGTVNVGGANVAAPGSLGGGTGGIVLKGATSAGLTVFSLNNNGTGSTADITYLGNNDVTLEGAATLNVDRNFIGGANSGNTIILDNLTMNGGILGVTGANSYALRFNGTTTLAGATSVFSPSTATLTLGGPITDGAGSRAVIMEGTGRLVIANSANTYDGVTAVKAGFLQLAPGANLGTGRVFVNGGALSLADASQTGAGTMPGGLQLVSQFGTSRSVLPVVGNGGFVIDAANPLNMAVPIHGLVLGLDGSFANNIDLAQAGGAGSPRVWVANIGGVDRTYAGTLAPAADNTIRLSSAANTLILAAPSALGGAASTANVVVGQDVGRALIFAGVNLTNGNGGTVSIRADNAATLGGVTVNRGGILNINGAITTPLGSGVVTALGGTLSTDDTTAAQFGNTDYRLFGGSTLLLNNAAVTTANTDRRLQSTANLDLTTSILRLLGDGGAATASAQTVGSIDYAGGSTISVDTDGTSAGRLTTLTTGSLNRLAGGRGTLNIRNTAATTTTFGTAGGTQKMIVTAAPAITHGMNGANLVLWGGTTSNDSGDPRFVKIDATHGMEPAGFNLSPVTAAALQGATAGEIVNLNDVPGTITMTGNATMQALRLRTTAATEILNSGAFSLELGSAAAVGQGAGFFIAHTANDTVTHAVNVGFGTQEGLIYAATPGGTSGVIVLGGVLSGSNGVTRFGDGILTLSGANTFTGPLTINSGETRLNNVAAAGPVSGTPNNIDLWGGATYLNATNQRLNNDVSFYNDARFGNVNIGGTAVNHITVAPRTGSNAAVILDIRNQAGTNTTTAYGGFTLNGPAWAYVTHILQIDGALSGAGELQKFGNERLFIGGDSIGYAQPVTVQTGLLSSLNATSSAKPFGIGAITINPAGGLRLAAATNLNAGQVTMNSDHGGISILGLSFVGHPATLPAMTVASSAPWKGTLGISAAGFSLNIDQATLWGGGSYLGASIGDTGTFTGVLSPDGGVFRLGTGQGTIRIASPLTGAGNSVQVGVSMTGDATGRADQVVNNSTGTAQFDVPMSYGGATIIHTGGALRVSATNAATALGPITLNGGTLQGDSLVSNFRMIAPLSIGNAINLTADGIVQMQNNAGDLRLTGNVSLAPGSIGAVRVLTVGIDGSNAGQLYLAGGVSDGAGGAGNHWEKGGQGAVFLTGPITFTGSSTVTGGLLAVNANADLASPSQVVLAGGGLAAWENSFTLDRDISFTGNGYLDVQAGLTLTQNASATYDGAGSIIKRGLGKLVLNGRNAQAALIVLDGIAQVNNEAALGDPARVGATDIQIGGDFALGGTTTVTRYTGGTLRINGDVITTRGITFNNNTSSIYSGGLDVTGANYFTVSAPIAQGTEFDYWFKTGTGALVATGANTFRQAAFTNGTYQFSTSTPWTNSTTTVADNTVLEWIGGTIRAVNVSGTLSLTNQASTTTYNYGGGLHLQMESGASLSVSFAADNLLRQNQGTLVIETAPGTTLGGVGNSNAARLIPTNAINASVARAAALTNGIFAPHLLAADITGVADFTTDDAATGIKPYIANGGSVIGSLSGSNPTSIANITSPQALTGLNRIYAFRTNADINGGTLVIPARDNQNMGGVLINGSNTIGTNLTFDPASAIAPGAGTLGEGLIYVMESENATITGTIMANALTKFGRGTLILAGNTAVLGEVSIQDGTVKVGGGSVFSRMNSELNINSGAKLDLNGNSIAVETLGGNNRQVTGTGGGVTFGGAITNDSGTASTLSVASQVNSTFTGMLDGNLRLVKAGAGVLTIDGFRASTPDSGSNTFTGGTEIYGVNTTGGLTLDNAPFGVGGASGTVSTVNLYNGAFGILYTGNATTFGIAAGTNGQQYNNLTVRIGADGTDGITLNVKGPGLVNVDRGTGAIGQGNLMQVGNLNLTDTTLTLTGANLYRLRVAGTTAIQGAQASFQTNSDGPSGALELAGPITGSGALNKLGDGTMRGIVIAGTANTYSGGTNIIGGDVQVTATSGMPLGSGPVRVFPDGTLRLAGNGSIDGTKLRVLSRVNAFGVVGLDHNFDPAALLNGANFGSVYQTALQLSQPYFTQPLNLAAIGDGNSFLISGLAQEVKYMSPTLGAGVADAWNPGTGVLRLAGGVNNLAFDGVDNVLTGGAYLQLGPQRNNVLGAVTNTVGSVIIRNSNNFTGGTQITEGTQLVIETGGSPIGDTPLGSGPVEVYGTLLIQGNLGSLYNANSSSPSNAVTLRPAGQVRIIDATNLVAGNNGRWGDAAGIDLNGGTFRYDGAANYQSVETIGAVTVRKGGVLGAFRSSTASSAQLNVASLARADRGVLTLNNNIGFLGINLTTPQSYERIVVAGGVSVAGTTFDGAGVSNPGIATPWIIDRLTNSFVGHNPTGAGTGFQPLASTTTPGAGQIAYSDVVTTALTAGLLSGTDIADLTTVANTLADNPSLFALRSNQNLSPTAANNAVTLTSGGLILTAGTINPTGAITAGVASPMTLNFGPGGNGEALIYVGAATSIIQAQINAAQGLTKFGPNQLTIQSINPGIGGPVIVQEGTLFARVPVSGSGSPVGTVFNGQDVILNAGSLVLAPQIANAAGTASELASNVNVTGILGSHIFVRGDATIGINNAAQSVRVGNLTVANDPGAPAMDGNGVIALTLQSGLWVSGTTTLSPQARINSTFNGFSQSTLAGQVTGGGGVIEKFGNGALTLLNGANNYSGGTTIHGSTNATAVSAVASAFRGSGTPFGSGNITVNPGGLLRLADNANIASNAVTMKSDGYGLAGIGLAHNSALPTIITTGLPIAGQIKVETTGASGGALALDYGYYSQPLNLAAIAGGDWWLGNSTQADAYYFNPALGANANGEYQLGAGGNQAHVYFGGLLVSAARAAVFENVFAGGMPGAVRVEVGALTAELAANGPSLVNGNTAGMGFLTRNASLTGDVRVNTNSTLNLGNNFALGSGRLVLNGGNLRVDAVQSTTIDNAVLLQGDFSTSNGNDFVINGNVTLHEGAAGATRIFNLAGTGTMGIFGVISGNDGSNVIKSGVQNVVFGGANTYQGYTQINQGIVIAQGDVLPGTPGPLGVSYSPIVLASGAANLAGGVSLGGKFTIARDLMLSQATGTGSALIESRTNERATVTGAVSLIAGGVLTVGSVAVDVTTFRGGSLDIGGVISGAGSVIVGTTAVAPGNGGTVLLSASANGYGTNTYTGGTSLNSARLQIGSDTYFTGPATNPTILSGPLGAGPLTFIAGEANRGGLIEAVGGPRTIVNALAITPTTAGNFTQTFAGREALTFTRDLNLSSDATLRSRTFTELGLWSPVTFSGNLSNSGVQGANLVKNGRGTLELSGTNTMANLLTTDANYGTGVFLDLGILRVNADAALGSTAALAAAGPHLLGPADLRMRSVTSVLGGTLSVSSSFSTARQVIFASNSTGTTNTTIAGIDVASGQTLTLTTPTALQTGTVAVTNATLIKSGPGTLALNSSANVQTALIFGGQASSNPTLGRFSHSGGTVSTTAVSGTPFVAGATGTITINGGVLSLVGGGVAQALSVPRLTYGAAAHLALNQGASSSALTMTDAAFVASMRGNPLNAVNYGTLVIHPSALANLGSTERFLTPATATDLVAPSIVTAPAGPGQDANFLRYNLTGGYMEHVVATVSTLAATAPANVGNITSSDVAGAGNIDLRALRTSANIAPTDGSTLVRINNGGLILNGNTAPTVSANLLFGTGAALAEALVHVRDGQNGASVLSGNLSARDFTKFGPGTLELSGGTNVLSATAARLPVLSVQEGSLRFANGAALFKNGLRGNEAGLFSLNVNESGVFDLNGLTLSIAGLAGNGTITTNIAGAVGLTARNGANADTTFNGTINNGSGVIGLTKAGNGILTLGGHSTYTGGTTILGGRVTNATGAPLTLGTLDARSATALGAGPVTLFGGILAINHNLAHSEVEDGIDFNTFGPGDGYNITVASTAIANGVTLPANLASTLSLNNSNTATLVGSIAINSLTLDAPMLTMTGAATAGNIALLFVKGQTSLSNSNTVLNLAGSRLFLGGQLQAAGKTITKIGANDLVLSHTEFGAGQNQIGLWKVYGGTINPRVADGASNPLGSNVTVELNGGTTGTIHLNLNTDGNGTTLSERVTVFQDTHVRFGSMLPVTSNEFVMTGASRINADRVLANSSNKTVVINSVEAGGALGSPYAYFTGGNSDTYWVNGPTSFVRDLYLQNDVAVTLNGLIGGSGTLVKRLGVTTYVNGDNTGGFQGGTIITGAPLIFGSLEGNQVTLSETARLGGGHVIVNASGQLQFNSAGNLQGGQNVYVSSNLDNFGVLRLAANLTLEQVNFRAADVGGSQAITSNYFLTNPNPATGALALNTIYTQPLDLRALGDGTWFLGSTNNAVGANGSYDAATLAPGFNNTYRLGAGGATLFFGSNGVSNAVTDVDASTPAKVNVGAPFSLQNNAVIGNGSGSIIFLTSQSYQGPTLINRSSTLDFRGTLRTSGIETYGGLNVAGETGTFLAGGSGANIPATLRPGSTLRFDNTSAGVLPLAATQGRWLDSAPILLDNATLRMQGNAAVETAETVGAITVNGGSFMQIVRGATGRGTELRTPNLTRIGAGTLTVDTTSDTLGSDERLIVTGPAPMVTSGMVAPWMVGNVNIDFLTYNAETGFSRAGFSRTVIGTQTVAFPASAERVLLNGAVVLNSGIDLDAYALRLDADVTLGTLTDSGAELILRSGGLISNGTRIITPGLRFGPTGTSEALLFNNGTTTIGDVSNATTSGQIYASSLTKFGAGTLVLQASQTQAGALSGAINVNQGALTLRFEPQAAVASTPTVNPGGAGGTIFLNGPNVTLNLLGGDDDYAAGVNTIFNNSVTIGDYNPIVQFVADRAGGAITDRRAIIGGNFTFGANNLEIGQMARFTAGNSFDIQLGDTATDLVTLKGKSVFIVDNAASGQARQLFVPSKVTGAGTLVKGRIDASSDLMQFDNVSSLNDWAGGTILAGGTLRVLAKANNVAAGASTNLTAGGLGTGAVTLMGGTLDLRVDNEVGGAPDTNAERTFFSATGNGVDLIVNGSATVNVDRTGLVALGTTKQIAFNNLTIGSQILTVSGGSTYGLEIAGATTLRGNMFVNNAVDLILGGSIGDGGAGLFINKIGTGVLWTNNNTSTLGGGAFINAGMLRFGTPRGASTTAQLGSGLITINPDAEIRLEAFANINTAAGQKVDLVSTAYAPAVFRTPALSQAQYQQLLTSTSDGLLSLLGTQSNSLDMSAIGNGRMYLTSVESDRTYNAGLLSPGLADAGGTNRVYRLGGRNLGTLFVNLAGAGNLGDMGGPTDVRIGSLANLGPQANWGLGLAFFQDQNTYTGTTTIVRGSSLRFDSNSTATAGPLGAPGSSAIHTYGVLQAEGTGNFLNTDASGSAYTNFVLHPGSELRLQDIDASGVAADRWHDLMPIALNGSLLTAQTANAPVDAIESVGAITFERGSRLQAVTQNTAKMFFVTSSLARIGRGTMIFIPSAVNRLGIDPANNSENILVSGSTPANVAGTNMLPGYFGVQVENRFATYGANGFAPVPDAQMVTVAAGLPSTSIVNVQANTTLLDSPNLFALRIGAFALSSVSGANNDSTLTFSGSGNDIGGIITSGAATIHPNLKFGATGSNEALINTVGGTLTFAGWINAGGVTKFSPNTLLVSNDQSDNVRGVGNGYGNGWVVNEGTLQLATFGSAGNAAPGNTIVLNGSQLGAAQLNLRAQPANTLLNYTYSSGRIIAVDNAVIDWDPGADDRVHSIADLEVQQAGGNGPVDAQLRLAHNRARSILAAGQLTLTNNAIVNVDTTADRSVFFAYTTTNTNLTTGTSSGVSIASLNGSGRFTKWGDGYLYVRGASPTFTGEVVIDEGAVQVNHHNALGSGAVTINRYGVLDIGVENYTPTNSTLTYNDASAERWSVDGARTGTVNLGKGTLQIAVNQTGAANVMLNGGSIEGWLRSDDVTETNRTSGVFRNLGQNIGFTLAGNSLVGTQYYEGANGLDMGKQTNDLRPLEEYFGSGVILEIKGAIGESGGVRSLTKVGYDIVILSGQNTYTGGTVVTAGKLMLGRPDALAPTGDLSTQGSGVLDLNGYNQTVGRLTNPTNPANPSTNGGYITNSAATIHTLTAGTGASGNYTYSGVLQNNVALTKAGSGTLTLDNTNTYRGKTLISAGTLKLNTNASIDDSAWIAVGPGAVIEVSAKVAGYTSDAVLSGGGADPAGTTYGSVVLAGRISGKMIIGDHVGEVSQIGTLAPGGSSLGGDVATAGNQIGHLYANDSLTLSGGLKDSAPAEAVIRLTLQFGGPTTTLAELGYTGSDYAAFVDSLPGAYNTGTASQNPGSTNAFIGQSGNLAAHDYLHVDGSLTLNHLGRIAVDNFGGYPPQAGDVFNLIDATTLVSNGFVIGNRFQTGAETGQDLDLPSLGNGNLWDTSQFASHGVLLVVPEPSQFALLIAGALGLVSRRNRRR